LRTSCVSHPAELPDLFIDRSLGRIQVPTLLRAAELRVVTLAGHYGIPADQKVRDAEWLQLVGERGWVALMKDSRVRSTVPSGKRSSGMPSAASASPGRI
jgi:hypothetical protein